MSDISEKTNVNNTNQTTQLETAQLETASQWGLFSHKNFWPLFWSQFTGAFNDNLYKNALMILIAFSLSDLKMPFGLPNSVGVQACAAFFILPFFLFSSIAGQVADWMDKAKLVFRLKLLEAAVVVVCCVALFSGNVVFMWLALFLFGTQATFFGPVKYSILPQHIAPRSLMGANALVESGTFVAILAGTIIAGLLISLPQGVYFLCALMLATAGVGLWSAKHVPPAKACDGAKKPTANIFKSSWQVIQSARGTLSVWRSVLAISWFWFFGATLLSQFPIIVKETIGADQSVVSLFLVIFSLGIAVGSALCEKLSSHRVEIGLVPLGAIGMAAFSLDFYFALGQWSVMQVQADFIRNFFLQPGSLRVVLDLAGMSICGGFFIVPLYSILQTRSEPSMRSGVIGANNILNALFMTLSAAVAGAILLLTNDSTNIILFLVVAHCVVAAVVFLTVPEFLLRFLVWALIHAVYRVKKKNIENLPEQGPALIVANHVSFVDALIIFGCTSVPVKFVMYYKIYRLPVLNWLFKSVGAIEIAPKKENESVSQKAIEDIGRALQKEEIVVIFPEGALSRDGQIQEFRPGVLKVIKSFGKEVKVIPCYLGGLWGSSFSRSKEKLSHRVGDLLKRKINYMYKRALKLFSPTVEVKNTVVSLLVGSPISISPDSLDHSIDQIDIKYIEQKVRQLEAQHINSEKDLTI